MLEETAGTSMYNDKKFDTEKLITKKDMKLKEMQNLLTNEIEP